MNYNEFKDYVKEYVLDYLPGQFADTEIVVSQIIKNNDVMLDSLIIRNPDSNMSPSIYLNSYFEQYQQGRTAKDIVKDIADTYIEHIAPNEEYAMNFNLDEITDYDKVKDYIYPRVSNLKSNMTRLSDVPYTVKEDLAITYHVKVNSDKETMGSILINNRLLKAYGVDIDTLHNLAMNNMEKISPPVFMPLSDVMVEIMAPDLARMDGISLDEARILVRDMIPNDGPQIYCLSNESRINGATYVMREEIQEMIAEKLGGDYYILPSSVHEVLVLPQRGDMRIEELQDMVQSVNVNSVPEEEVLSDGVYQYDAKSHTFSRCDKTPELTYKQEEERTNTMDLNPGFAMAESKQEYDSTTPNQTHEPIKHKAH